MAVLPTTRRIAPEASARTVTPRDVGDRIPYAIILAVMLGNFLGPLYSSTANVIVPNLIASFGADVNTIEWVVTGYMLGYSTAMPLAGWLADTYGRRRTYLLGLTMFVAFSIAASLAWNTWSLIAFRILQAVGGGIISPTAMAIMTDVVPPARRGMVLGLWGMGMMLAPAFGPWISGLIVDNLDDWRLVFWLGVPIGIAGLVAASLVLPQKSEERSEAVVFDAPGFAMLASAIAAFLIPLTQGNRVGWDDDWIRTSFVAAALLFVGFVWRELHCEAPMLDLRLFAERTFAVAVVLRMVVGLSYYFAIFLLPLFTQDVLGWDATQSGAVLIPAGLTMSVLMPISGTLADRIGSRPLVLTGMCIAAYGTLLFASIDNTWDAVRIMLCNAVRTGAIGVLFTPLTIAALMKIPRTRIGAASGMLNTVWQLGGSLGIALGETYLTNRTAERFSEIVSSATVSHAPFVETLHRLQAVALAHHLPPDAALVALQRILLNLATIRAYGDTFFIGAAIMAATVPAAWFLGKGSVARRSG